MFVAAKPAAAAAVPERNGGWMRHSGWPLAVAAAGSWQHHYCWCFCSRCSASAGEAVRD